MLRFSPFSAFACVALCLTVLSGCGQKGPLYLPQKGKPAASAPIRTTGAVTPATVEPSVPVVSPDSK